MRNKLFEERGSAVTLTCDRKKAKWKTEHLFYSTSKNNSTKYFQHDDVGSVKKVRRSQTTVNVIKQHSFSGPWPQFDDMIDWHFATLHLRERSSFYRNTFSFKCYLKDSNIFWSALGYSIQMIKVVKVLVVARNQDFKLEFSLGKNDARWNVAEKNSDSYFSSREFSHNRLKTCKRCAKEEIKLVERSSFSWHYRKIGSSWRDHFGKKYSGCWCW